MLAITAFLHNFDPYAIQFGNSGFGIRWYGLAYLAGFLFGYWFIAHLARKARVQLSPQLAGDFVFSVALGTILGGRLGFCLLYDPSLFTDFSPDFPFWGVLAIHKGGMASHGGILGIILACLYFAHKHKLNPHQLFDLTTTGGSIGIFFGRLANFINGELVGRPSSADLPWAVKYPTDILLWPSQEPQRLNSITPLIKELGLSEGTWLKAINDNPVSISVQHILQRIVQAVYSGNEKLANMLQPQLTARHPSQIYEALLEGAFLFLVMSWLWTKKPKPGVITGYFLVLYSIVRILGEQFRMPDLQIGFQLLGLTRGQWLSLIMLIPSVGYLLWAMRKKA